MYNFGQSFFLSMGTLTVFNVWRRRCFSIYSLLSFKNPKQCSPLSGLKFKFRLHDVLKRPVIIVQGKTSPKQVIKGLISEQRPVFFKEVPLVRYGLEPISHAHTVAAGHAPLVSVSFPYFSRNAQDLHPAASTPPLGQACSPLVWLFTSEWSPVNCGCLDWALLQTSLCPPISLPWIKIPCSHA